jgi:O-antigen/teichoic acid export membrane protein
LQAFEASQGASGAVHAEPASTSSRHLRRSLALGTAANYVLLLVRMMTGILLIRVLFLNLAARDYGFWVLMWSIFGYVLLLDLGFGVALQKYAGQVTADAGWSQFNRRFSTVFFAYVAMGGVIAVLTVVGLPLVRVALGADVPAVEAVTNVTVFLLFGLSRAVVFPLAVLPEVLVGLQKMVGRNCIAAGFALANFGALWATVHLGLGLTAMTLVTFAAELVGFAAMALYLRRAAPKLQLRWSLFDRRLIGTVLSFSVFAHMATLARLIVSQTDKILISAVLGIAMVPMYHVVWRLTSTFQEFATQLVAPLGPIAVGLHESRNHDLLRRVLIDSARVVAAVATATVIPLAVFLGPLLKIWVGLENPAAHACGLILLAAAYVQAVFSASTSRVLMLCGRERTVATTTLIEALLNLGLSVALCLLTDLGIVGVALGTLVPTVLAGVVYLSLACRFAGIGIGAYVIRTLRGTVVSGAIAAAVSVWCLRTVALEGLALLVLSMLPGLAVFFAAMVCVGMNASERRRLVAFVRVRWTSGGIAAARGSASR